MTNDSKKSEKSEQSRSARKRAKTRADLLNAARYVFAQCGYHDASIAEITARADVGVGTFYLHFRDKDDAFTTLLDEGFRNMKEDIKAEISQTATLTLSSVVAAVFRHAYIRRDLFQIALTAREQFARTRTFYAQDHLADYLTMALEAAQAHELLEGYDLAVTARLITGMITQGIFWWFENTEPGPEIMTQQVLLLLSRGLPEMLFLQETTET